MMRKFSLPLLALLAGVSCAIQGGGSSVASSSLSTGSGSSSGTNSTKPVLIAIANNGFYYQEYADPRRALEESNFTVVVAAGTNGIAIPHANTGQPAGTNGNTAIDLPFILAVASNYSALVISGGWGATKYYYAFTGTLDDAAWSPDALYAAQLNSLISNFLASGKTVLGVCNGVNVLSWARVGGNSPLSNKAVCAPYLSTPGVTYLGTNFPSGLPMHVYATHNGATVQAENSVGNPSTNFDDVAVDGLVMTAQDNFSAYRGGQLLAERLSGN